MLKSCATFLFGLIVAGTAVVQAESTPQYGVVARIPGPDGGWDLLGVDPVAGRLYVARSGGVMAVDLASGNVTPNLVPGTSVHAAIPIPGTTRVLSTNGGANTASIFQGATGEVIATLPVGTKPDAAAWDPVSETVWVMTPGSGNISVVDPRAAKVVATVSVGGSLELGVADGTGRLYVNVEDKNEVVVLDTRVRKVLGHFPLAGCERPTGIAYAPELRLLLSACANGIAVVSAPDGHEVASLAVGPRPDGAVYEPDRKLAFVPSGGDGALYVIRLSPTPVVVQRLETARGARTIALDSGTGRLYLPSAEYGPVAGAARPAMIPGTFSLLVVAPALADR